MKTLKYGNTNTYYLPGSRGGLLIDTDYAGMLPVFYKAIKANQIDLKDISCVIATHYHPDHMGLISELMKQKIRLLLIDTQRGFVHFSDPIFNREKHLHYIPIDETEAVTISCRESRDFLSGLGISGEIISTPSHSPDSISLILDNGDCFVGDLEPIDYLPAYAENPSLKADWDRIMSFHPKRIFYGHANMKIIQR
jgi:glyoxylase-like metal-dependent hydrolase (beta-lactamase superfamily II)